MEQNSRKGVSITNNEFLNIQILEYREDKLMEINTLEKDSVNRTNFQNGLMPEKTAEGFIKMIFESTPLLKACRTKILKAEKETLAGILEQKGQTRIVGVNNTGSQGVKDSEDQSAYRRTMSGYKFTLDTHEYSLSRTLSNKVLSDNIESKLLGSQIASNLANMVRVDLEDSAINSRDVDPSQSITATLSNAPATAGTTFQVGASQPAGFPVDGSKGWGYLRIDKGGDIELCSYTALVDNAGTWEFQGVTRTVTDEDGALTSTNINLAISDTITWYRHHLRGVDDGWIRIFESPHSGMQTSNKVDGALINSGNISFLHFNDMLKALPKKYRSQDIVYIMSSDQLMKYRDWLLTNHSQPFAQQIIGDSSFAPTLGKNVITPDDWRDDIILLTPVKNLIFGIWQNINMRKVTADTDSKLADTDETYWNLRLRAGFTVERTDAGVLCTGLTV